MTLRATALAESNPELAAHLADWAWYADSNDPEVVQGALKVYSQRVTRPLPTQEVLVYPEHMMRLQAQCSWQPRITPGCTCRTLSSSCPASLVI